MIKFSVDTKPLSVSTYIVSGMNNDKKELPQYPHQAYCSILHGYEDNHADFSVFIGGHELVSNEPALDYTALAAFAAR